MGIALGESVIARHRRWLGRKVKRITIDLDPTDDPTHGAQQLTFFNGHYDSWCYLLVAGFLTFNQEPEQYLFCYVLRPGNAPGHPRGADLLRPRGCRPQSLPMINRRRTFMHKAG